MIKYLVFEPNPSKTVDMEPDDFSSDIAKQLFTSDYCDGNVLYADKFLRDDLSIDLEKLELAIMILIDHLQKSVKIENPIYINLAGINDYIAARKIHDDKDRIGEEITFLFQFCKAIADENKLDSPVEMILDLSERRNGT